MGLWCLMYCSNSRLWVIRNATLLNAVVYSNFELQVFVQYGTYLQYTYKAYFIIVPLGG